MAKRRRSKSNAMPITYYRLVFADSPEAAEQEGLARVLEAILPDTMDEWNATATLIERGDPTRGQLDKYDVKVDFHRVKRGPDLQEVTDPGSK